MTAKKKSRARETIVARVNGRELRLRNHAAVLGWLLTEELLWGERPEFAGLKAQINAQIATRSGIKGQYGPSLSFVGSAEESGFALDKLVTNMSAYRPFVCWTKCQ